MIAVIQKVSSAAVYIGERSIASIAKGCVVLVGIQNNDTEKDIEWLTQKMRKLRIYEDENGDRNDNIEQSTGEMLIISQFTLLGEVQGSNRPTYIKAKKKTEAEKDYEELVRRMKVSMGTRVKTGVFGADMQVRLVNEGPVTIIINSKTQER